jgi:hypothetical protein
MPHQSTKLLRACEYCGSSFSIYPAWLRLGAGRHCSNVCAGRSRRRSLADRLWARVVKTPTCWLVSGHLLPSGYARVMRGDGDRTSISAHRAAWMLASGATIPPGYSVLHTCDNRACVRNDEPGIYIIHGVEYQRWGHLFLGTQQQNIHDMYSKGRGYSRTEWHRESARAHLAEVRNRARGEAHHRARLTEAQVLAIRAEYLPFKMTARMLAARYGVSIPTIRFILRRRIWQHLP